MPPNCSRCARWWICTWRGKNCCSWHRLSPGAKVADHGRAAQAGGRPEKTESERLHRLAEHLLPRRHGLIQSFLRTVIQDGRKQMKKSGDPLLNTMRHQGIPITRENYLMLAFMGRPPTELHPEQEAELPAELQAPDDGEEE